MTPLRRASVGAFALVLLAPAIAGACPVCFNARDGARIAYIGTAILMTLLPLTMAGVVGLWIRCGLQAQAEREGARSEGLGRPDP